MLVEDWRLFFPTQSRVPKYSNGKSQSRCSIKAAWWEHHHTSLDLTEMLVNSVQFFFHSSSQSLHRKRQCHKQIRDEYWNELARIIQFRKFKSFLKGIVPCSLNSYQNSNTCWDPAFKESCLSRSCRPAPPDLSGNADVFVLVVSNDYRAF